MTVAAVAE
jgi:hypothetical protein